MCPALQFFLSSLKTTFRACATGEYAAQPFIGVVESTEPHPDQGYMVFDVHSSGAIYSCALPMNAQGVRKSDLPKTGDIVRSILNPHIDPVDMGHRRIMAVLDFENISAAARTKNIGLVADNAPKNLKL